MALRGKVLLVLLDVRARAAVPCFRVGFSKSDKLFSLSVFLTFHFNGRMIFFFRLILCHLRKSKNKTEKEKEK